MSVRARLIREAGTVTGAVLGLRDIQEAVLQHRAVTTLRSANAILARTQDEDGLLHAMCEVAVDHSGYLFAWYGRAVDDDGEVRGRGGVEPGAPRLPRSGEDHLERRAARAAVRRAPACAPASCRSSTTSHRPLVPTLAGRGEARTASARRCASRCSWATGSTVCSTSTPRSPAPSTRRPCRVMKEVAAQLGYGIARLRDAATASSRQRSSEQRLLHTAIDQARRPSSSPTCPA